MNHLEIYQLEKYVPKGEREWLSWAATVEHALGHSLDGDQGVNGYSLDFAYNWFKSGAKPMNYVKEIKTGPNYSVRENI